jgi:hypothetical protein
VTVTAYLTSRNVAFALAVVIGLGAFAGSATELWRIAERAHYGLPIGVVFALDGLAVVCVIVLATRKDWQALVTLVATTLLSIGLQVLAVPQSQALDLYVSAVVVHALVPLASFMAVHLATRLDRPDPTAAKPPRPKTAPRPPAPVKVPASPARPREVEPTPLRPPRPDAQPLRPAAGTDELVALAVDVAAGLGKAPADLSRSELQAGVKAHPSRNGVGIGTAKAGQILDHFRTRPTPELEVVR